MSSSDLTTLTLVLVPIDSHPPNDPTEPQQGLAYGHGHGHVNSNSKSSSKSNSNSNSNDEEIDPEFERRPPMMLSYPSPYKKPMDAIYMHDPTSRDHQTKYRGASTLALGRNISTRIFDVKLSRRLATVEFRNPPIPGLTGMNSSANDGNGNGNNMHEDGHGDEHEHGDGDDYSHLKAKVILKVNQSNIHHRFCLNGSRVIFEEMELEDGDEISLHGDKYMYQVHILESRARARRARGSCSGGGNGGGDNGGDGAGDPSSSSRSRQNYSADASTVYSGDAAATLAPVSLLPYSNAITNASKKEILKIECEKAESELKIECMKAESELKMECKSSPESPSPCTSKSTMKRPRDENISFDDAAALQLAKTESTASAITSIPIPIPIPIPVSTVETDKIQQVARQQILDEVSCPICMEIIVHAHVANPCGHIFCKSCIGLVYNKNNNQPSISTNLNGHGQNSNSNSNSNSNHRLWEHVGMVAFADHCVIENNEEEKTTIIHKRKPFETFMRQKESRPQDRPIFAGVVLSNWEEEEEQQPQQTEGISKTLKAFQRKGIDYVRLECNFGSSIDDIGGPTEFVDNPRFRERFGRLARAARACQTQEMVPLILLQFPWRDPGPGVSMDCFKQAVKSFARALKEAEVDPERVLFETRPPIGISAQQERGLSGSERMQLGLDIGQNMFGVIQETLGPIAGFCVAGGSTKGEFPTAMEDDTQNAVRQGMRMCAKQAWGYDLCYWEMGAKLMLQPKVGRLWSHGASGKDAARELFMVNAEDMADEIRAGIVVQ